MTNIEIGLVVWAVCAIIVLIYAGIEIYKHGWSGYVEVQRIDQNLEYLDPKGVMWGIIGVAVFAPIVLPVIIIQLLLK